MSCGGTSTDVTKCDRPMGFFFNTIKQLIVPRFGLLLVHIR